VGSTGFEPTSAEKNGAVDDDLTVETVQRRRGPISLLVGRRTVTLLAADTNVLIEALEQAASALTRDLARVSREQPQSLALAQRRVEELRRLVTVLATAPSRLMDPPLAIGTADVQLLRTAFAEIVGYQKQQLTPDLEELKLAVNSQGA
jgi:hypothetical protein